MTAAVVARWPLPLFRATATAAAVLVFAQAALAGGFLAGHFEALAMHSRNGGLVALVFFGQLVCAVLLWRKGGGPTWPARTAVLQLAIAAALIPLGEERVLAVHIPLAVGLSISTALLVSWAWRWQR
ncbi:hypothetical protein [Nocardia donostiensis]|uniref:Uncharacterized protein n=1 Tax=Nocardia donostiensis TaxID=1538463 RepID=A0A1W0BI88_9NOCA|nr:hypothetical protein [Nocardia donostiensis]ONM49857.1 hypothetical protein B0T46_05560 [Nocardia donostiensis]OQS22193.1 hypothetical protein B0T44_05980 [Nocardia donostiensis]